MTPSRPEEFFKTEAKRLGLSIRQYCRRFGIVYASLIGRDVNYGEPTVPLSSLDERQLSEAEWKRRKD